MNNNGLNHRAAICVGALGFLALAACALPALGGAPSSRPATHPSRPRAATRPTLTDDEYQQLADDLRAQYSRPSDQWPKPTIDPGAKFTEIGLLPEMTYPKDNPFSQKKAKLGKELFFDPRLSSSGAIACASCHDPDLAWTDGKTLAFGHARQQTSRNAPSIMNSGFGTFQFWDGRAHSLEEQAIAPIVSDNEMHEDLQQAADRIGAVPEYRAQFKAVFGSEEVDMDRIVQAIATFERTIVGGQSKFDAFVGGKNPKALNDEAIRGLHLFRTTARCINCHNGPNFTDGEFHDVGLSYYGNKLHQDLGRYNATKNPADVGKFKTPSLRNVARTGPYMHNGLFDELGGVINMYNAGMPSLRRSATQASDPLFPDHKDPLLKPLGLNTHDRADLIAFLESLNERKIRIRPPPLPGMKSAAPTTHPAEREP
jgi:cytochrome c peroxidase